MKWAWSILVFSCVVSAVAVAPVSKPFEDYQVILDREPFGAPPDPLPDSRARGSRERVLCGANAAVGDL